MKRLVLASLPACLSLVFFGAACGGDDDDDDTADDGSGSPDAGVAEVDAAVDTGLPVLEDGWNEIVPGGDTICSRGSEFAYWVRKGTVNKVVIDYIGGGACWDALTCGFADSLFEETVDSVRTRIEDEEPAGFYDDQNPDNPFKDWYHVVIPYCTGDVHWGDAVAVYGEGTESEVTINHKGAVNSRAVLDWVFGNFDAPEQVMVTGCSAGSYGAALWSAFVMQHYPDSQVFQFGDSGAGIITDEFFQDSFPSWNAVDAFPSFIPELDPDQVDILTTALPDLYAGIAGFFPDQWMSQYNTTFDENQHFFYQAMGGGDVAEWSTKMLASIAEIEERTPNFSSFIAPGTQHCILPYDNFYTVETGGVKLTDWLNELLTQRSVESVSCVGEDCDIGTP
ncbi:MAG TPA: pectin acetylesterase-family hydrolase [Kofleriaceae bacterium]|nr:pectin acetylesterase-family hydrolase [Kofleriaceae bacterium]